MARQQAIAARFEGISDLRARGVHVFMTREEWKGESEREMKAWNEKDLKSLLERGPAFRTIPAPLSRQERETALNRAQVTMRHLAQKNLRKAVHAQERKPAGATFFAKDLGLREDTFRKDKTPIDDKPETWERKVGEVREAGVKVYLGKKVIGGQMGFESEPKTTAPGVKGWVELMREAGEGLSQEMIRRRGAEKSRWRAEDGLERGESAALAKLAADPRRWVFTKGDKGGAGVLISRKRLDEEARKVVQDKKAYTPVQEFVGRLEGGEARPKIYWGAEEEEGTRRWESTLRIGLESEDDWYTETGVMRALSARLEHFLDKILTIPLPDEVRDALLAKKRLDKNNTRDDDDLRATWRAVLVEIIVKLHKMAPGSEEIKSRPVGRGHASPFRQLEGLIGSVLTQVLEEIENMAQSQKEDGSATHGRIILTESKQFVQELDQINIRLQREEWGRGETEYSLLLVTWDVEAMYPSLSHAFVIKEIDMVMMARIEQAQQDRGARQQAVKSREMLMQLLLFALEHQLVYVNGIEQGVKHFYHAHEGVGIGKREAGAVANLVPIRREREILAQPRDYVREILMYRRYIDDIWATIMVKRGREMEVLHKLTEDLNSIDQEGGCIKVQGKAVWVGLGGDGKVGGQAEMIKKEEGKLEWAQPQEQAAVKEIEFLDVNVRIESRLDTQKLVTGVYRKAAAADMYIPKDSHHPSSLMRGMVKGELVRFTRICNEEEERDKAWERFSLAMQRRGHEKKMLERVIASVPYTERSNLMRKREEAEESLGMPLIVPHKPGAKEWWKECKKNGGAMLEGIWRPAADYLPRKLFACLKSTDNLAAAIKKGGKRRRGQSEKEAGEYEARMMKFRAKGWLTGGAKQDEQGGIEELATGTIEWALGLSTERPSVGF